MGRIVLSFQHLVQRPVVNYQTESSIWFGGKEQSGRCARVTGADPALEKMARDETSVPPFGAPAEEAVAFERNARAPAQRVGGHDRQLCAGPQTS